MLLDAQTASMGLLVVHLTSKCSLIDPSAFLGHITSAFGVRRIRLRTAQCMCHTECTYTLTMPHDSTGLFYYRMAIYIHLGTPTERRQIHSTRSQHPKDRPTDNGEQGNKGGAPSGAQLHSS